MGITNPVHLAFIAMIALIVLGPKRLPELAKSLGHGMREFRDSLSSAMDTDDTDLTLAPGSTTQPGVVNATAAEQPAGVVRAAEQPAAAVAPAPSARVTPAPPTSAPAASAPPPADVPPDAP